jgi:hypothetical protein
MNLNQPISITLDLRRFLRLSAHPGSTHRTSKQTPTISQYARWCQCTPQLLGKFARGVSKGLGHEILDDLAVLAGLYPAATLDERLTRYRLADEWLGNEELRATFPRVRHFICDRIEADDREP